MTRCAVRLGLLLLLPTPAACSGPDSHAAADATQGQDADQPAAADADDAAPGPDPSPRLPHFQIRVDPGALARLRSNADPALELAVTVEHAGQPHPGVQLELHGGYGRTVPKKSYRLTFPDRLSFDLGQGPEPVRELVFQACWIDPTFARQRITMDLLREAGALAPRLVYATLAFAAEPPGLYAVIERIDREFLRRQGLAPQGAVFKAVNHWADWSAKADPLAGFEIKVNPVEDPAALLGPLLDALSHTPTTVAAFREQVEHRLSLADFLRYQLYRTFAQDRDAFTKNYYLHVNHLAPPGTPGARFRLISWDADATWGISWDGSRVVEPDLSWHGNNLTTERFSPRLFAIPEYRAHYLDQYQDALAGALQPVALSTRLRAIRHEIEATATLDAARWHPGLDLAAEYDALDAFFRDRHTAMTRRIDELRTDSGLE